MRATVLRVEGGEEGRPTSQLGAGHGLGKDNAKLFHKKTK